MFTVAPGVVEYGPAGTPSPGKVRITSRQGKLELLYSGKYGDVLAAIEAMSEPARTAALIEWNGPFWERDSDMVASMGLIAGWDAEALDSHFSAAAQR